MKPYPRSNSVVDSVASASAGIRNQRADCLAVLDQKGGQISSWIQETLKFYKTQIREKGSATATASHCAGGAEELEIHDSLPDDLIAWIDSLKKKELQQELRGRELNTTGLKDELRGRLIESMLEERRKAAHSSTDSGKNDLKVVDQPVEKTSLSVQEYVEKPDQSNDVEMKDAANVEIPMSNTSTEEMDVDDVVPKHDISQHKKKEPEEQIATEGNVKDMGSTSSSTKQTSVVDVPQPQSPTRASRSPLRRMQAGVQSAFKNRMQNTVQSALKNLRPVSPKKSASESQKSPPKPKKEVVVLPEIMSASSAETTKKSAGTVGSETKISTSSAPKPQTAPTAGAVRAFTTPGTTTLSATSKLGSLNINSESVKAKNSARMARIAEIRNKSKAVTATSTKGQSGLSTYTALKGSVSVPKNATLTNSKRQILASQMREKTFGRLGEAAAVSNAAPSHHQPAKQPLVEFKEPKKTSTPHQMESSTPPPSAKSLRSPVLSPMDTYEMSDHGGSSDTDEEEERTRRVGKHVPKWASKENLRQALQHQYTDCMIDPDEMFGEVNTCNLEAIFGRRKSKYHKRTSSGNWTRDKATVAEKLAFKRQMGYDVKT